MTSTTLLLKKEMAEFVYRDAQLTYLEADIQRTKECRYSDYSKEMGELSAAIDDLAQRNIVTIQKNLGTMRERWNALNLQLTSKSLAYLNQRAETLAKESDKPSTSKFPQFLRLQKELHQFNFIPRAAKDHYISTQALLMSIGNNKTEPLFITKGYVRSRCVAELHALYAVFERVEKRELSLEKAQEQIACLTTSFSFLKGSMNMYLRVHFKSHAQDFTDAVYWTCCEFALHGFVMAIQREGLIAAEKEYLNIFTKLNIQKTYAASYVQMKAYKYEKDADGAFRVIVSMCDLWGIEMPRTLMDYLLS